MPTLLEKHKIDANCFKIELVLRPHPSDPVNKYEEWIKRNSTKWFIILDKYLELEKSLALSDIAFGCESQALVAAMAIGIPVYSTLPKFAGSCRLPHVELNHLRELVEF